MIQRYSLPEAEKIWTDEERFSIWLEIEIAACEANHKLGLIPDEDLKYDAFVASPRTLTGYKPMKLIKKAHRNILRDPFILFNKKKHTIKLHFDMFHMYDGLIKASSVMTGKQQESFLNEC